MDGNELTANFVATTRWENLPEAVKKKTLMCLVDNVGAAISGTLTRVSEITADYAVQCWPGDQATILLRGKKASAVGAAFANGWTANGLDIDDGIQYAYGHAGAQLFPTTLAVAEALDLDGHRLLAALSVGYEVSHRIGRCWHDHHEIYQACGSWGTVGCAAAAANLMDLPPDQVWHALGIAEYHAPNLPMMRDIDNPAMVKHGIGWGAMTGLMSAQLASKGFTGIPTLLAFDQYQEWARDIGEHYIMVDGVAWKAKGYASCSWSHAPAEGAKRLIDQHKFDVEEIDAIHIDGFHETVRLGTRLPRTTEEAQFNVAWPVACMLVDGEIGPDQTLEKRLSDPQICELAQKVTVTESEEFNELCRLYEIGDPRGRFSGAVTIRLKNGQEYFSGRVDSEEAYPPTGWNEERINEKFRWLASFVLDDPRTETVLDLLWHFDEVKTVRKLTNLLYSL
jgi:2-methylcitrate dehydratase PrpD